MDFLTPASELDLSLLAKGACGAVRTGCVTGGLVEEMAFSFREFNDPLALLLGGGDCAFRVSIFSDRTGSVGAECPSEVCIFRLAGGNAADGAGAFFLDFPNKKDMVECQRQ